MSQDPNAVGDKYRLLGLPTTVSIGSGRVMQGTHKRALRDNGNDTNARSAISQNARKAQIALLMAISTPALTPETMNSGGG